MFASSTIVGFIRGSGASEVKVAVTRGLSDKVMLAEIARCPFRTISDAGATFLIAASTGRILFNTLGTLYPGAAITIFGMDKGLGFLGLVDAAGTALFASRAWRANGIAVASCKLEKANVTFGVVWYVLMMFSHSLNGRTILQHASIKRIS